MIVIYSTVAHKDKAIRTGSTVRFQALKFNWYCFTAVAVQLVIMR